MITTGFDNSPDKDLLKRKHGKKKKKVRKKVTRSRKRK